MQQVENFHRSLRVPHTIVVTGYGDVTLCDVGAASSRDTVESGRYAPDRGWKPLLRAIRTRMEWKLLEKLKAGCIFALLALLALDAMAATDSDVYRLKSEVSQLRSQVRSLERQVRQLEEQMRQVRDRQLIPANKMSTSPWHQLRVGMSKDQVTSLLGEATEEDAGAGVDVGKDVWQYTERGHVEFDAAGRVSRWKAP